MKRNGARGELVGTRILLVEDADDIRDAFGVLLRTEGASVSMAATGREAIELAAQDTYDLLVTDLGLPDIPGEILIREVLATASPRPRVVVLTGYGEPYTGRARAAGADVVLTKPIEWTGLLRELRKGRAAAPTALAG